MWGMEGAKKTSGKDLTVVCSVAGGGGDAGTRARGGTGRGDEGDQGKRCTSVPMHECSTVVLGSACAVLTYILL